jgi:hypothetical protein
VFSYNTARHSTYLVFSYHRWRHRTLCADSNHRTQGSVIRQRLRFEFETHYASFISTSSAFPVLVVCNSPSLNPLLFITLVTTFFVFSSLYVGRIVSSRSCIRTLVNTQKLCLVQLIYLQLINPLRLSGNYMNHLLWQSVMLHFVFIGFGWFSM